MGGGDVPAIHEGLAGCHHKDVAMWTSEVRV